MAKDKSLYKELRAHGVRRGRAKKISSSLASRKGSDRPRTAKRAVEDLRAAASRIQDRMALDEDRRAAAAKAARTRKKKAKKRKQGAKKLAAGRSG